MGREGGLVTGWLLGHFVVEAVSEEPGLLR